MIQPKKDNILTMLFLLLGVINITAQSDSLGLEENDFINLGYGQMEKSSVSTAVTSMSSKDFNQGLINDPLMLIRGRLPGVQIYNRGGDLNTSALVQIRGLSSLGSDRVPLIIIDGVADVSLDNIDPNDIEKITVLRDASAAAQFGIRAINGAIILETKNGSKANLPFQIDYKSQLAGASAYPGIPVLSSDEYRAVGGFDLGASINWLDEVTQTGISNTHHLGLSGKIKNSNYRISGNFRDQNAVLKNTGFNSINSRFNFSTKTKNEKLVVDLGGAYTSAKRDLGFYEAFRYAITFNPTAPINGADVVLPFNESKYGGFYQELGLFDVYNPLAIVEQNKKKQSDQLINLNAQLVYKLMDNWSLNLILGHQDISTRLRAFHPTDAYYLGNAISVFEENQGAAELLDIDRSNNSLDVFSNYEFKFNTSKLNLMLGYSQQVGNYNSLAYTLNGYSDESSLVSDDASNIDTSGVQYVQRVMRGWDHSISAITARAQLNLKEIFFLTTSIRREGSSRLAKGNQFGIFPSASAALDLTKSIPAFDQLKLRVGYGAAGGIPFEGGWSQDYTRDIEVNGSIVEDLVRPGNPNLTWERQSELNVGLDFKLNWFSGAIDAYSRKNTDLILLNYYSERSFSGFENSNELSTTGIDISLNAELVNTNKIKFKAGIIFSTSEVKIQKHFDAPQVVGSPGGPGHGSTAMLLLQEGESLGDFWGPSFLGVDEDGNAIFEDLNNDGEVNSSMNYALEPIGDFEVLGNAFPDFELAWNNQLKLGPWNVSAFFRGAFGHSLINLNRMFYEAQWINSPFVTNFVNTELTEENLRLSRWGSHVVEKASFFKLDNLSISRKLTIQTNKRPLNLNVSITGQNLFTITKYTGADPEPVLASFGPNSASSIHRYALTNPLEAGIDRRDYFLPSRTVIFGLNVSF